MNINRQEKLGIVDEIEAFIADCSVSPQYAISLREMAEEAKRNGGRHFCAVFEGKSGPVMKSIMLRVGLIELLPDGIPDHYQFPEPKRLEEIAEQINAARKNGDAPLLPPIG